MESLRANWKYVTVHLGWVPLPTDGPTGDLLAQLVGQEYARRAVCPSGGQSGTNSAHWDTGSDFSQVDAHKVLALNSSWCPRGFAETAIHVPLRCTQVGAVGKLDGRERKESAWARSRQTYRTTPTIATPYGSPGNCFSVRTVCRSVVHRPRVHPADGPAAVRREAYREALDGLPGARVQRSWLTNQALLVSVPGNQCYHHFILDKLSTTVWTNVLLFDKLLFGSERCETAQAATDAVWLVTVNQGNLHLCRSKRPDDITVSTSIVLTDTAQFQLVQGGGIIVDTDPTAEWTAPRLIQSLLPFYSCAPGNAVVPAVAPPQQGAAVHGNAGNVLLELLRMENGVYKLIADYLRTHPQVPRGRRVGMSLVLRSTQYSLVEAAERHFRIRYRLLGTPEDLAAFQAVRRANANIKHVVIDVVPTTAHVHPDYKPRVQGEFVLDVTPTFMTSQRSFWHKMCAEVMKNKDSVVLRAVTPCKGDAPLYFPKEITLTDVMLETRKSVSVYGLYVHPNAVEDWSRLPHGHTWDELVLSHGVMAVTEATYFENLWTTLLQAVRKTLVFDLYTVGTSQACNALWDAFALAVNKVSHLPDHMELCVHSDEARFKRVIEAVLTHQDSTRTTLSARLDRRAWDHVPTLIQAADMARASLGDPLEGSLPPVEFTTSHNGIIRSGAFGGRTPPEGGHCGHTAECAGIPP